MSKLYSLIKGGYAEISVFKISRVGCISLLNIIEASKWRSPKTSASITTDLGSSKFRILLVNEMLHFATTMQLLFPQKY